MTVRPTADQADPPATRRLLRGHVDFRQLWLATTVSQLGTQVSELGIPLAAILLLHAGAVQVGLLAAAGYLPLALLGLPAGAWADRLPRRSVLIGADLARCLVLASIPIAYLLGSLTIGQLYIVTFCVGGLSVFLDVAYPAYLPSLVARSDLGRANSRLQVSEQGAAFLGPGLAGWLIGLVGAAFAITADAASYLASAALLGRIKHRETKPSTSTNRTRLRTEIVEGLRAVATNRVLRAIALSAAIVNLFGRMIVVLLPLYLIRTAGYGPTTIGIVFAIGSIGFLLGAATADHTARRLGLGPAILAGATVAALAFLLIAAAPTRTAAPFVVAALFIYGIGALTFTVNNATLRQLTIESQLLGRTTAAMRQLVWIAQPIAGVTAGWLGHRVGIHTAIWIGAIGALTAPIPLLAAKLSTRMQAEPSTPAPQST